MNYKFNVEFILVYFENHYIPKVNVLKQNKNSQIWVPSPLHPSCFQIMVCSYTTRITSIVVKFFINVVKSQLLISINTHSQATQCISMSEGLIFHNCSDSTFKEAPRAYYGPRVKKIMFIWHV